MNIEELNVTIRKLQAEDGDLIVVTCPQSITRDHRLMLQEALGGLLHELHVNAKSLVLDGGMDIKVIKTSQLKEAQDEAPTAA